MLSVSVPQNSTVKLYGGYIKVCNITKTTSLVNEEKEKNTSILSQISSFFIEDTYAALPKINHRVEDQQLYYIGNIKTITFTSWISYISQSKSVISIQDANGVCYCRAPLVHWEQAGRSSYIFRRRANLKLYWKVTASISFGPISDLSGERGISIHLIGDHNGNKVSASSKC